jgi:hypothetical protein
MADSFQGRKFGSLGKMKMQNAKCKMQNQPISEGTEKQTARQF